MNNHNVSLALEKRARLPLGQRGFPGLEQGLRTRSLCFGTKRPQRPLAVLVPH